MPTPFELYDQAADRRDQGDKEGAVAKLEEAVALDPNFALGHGMLAKLYADLAVADKAIAHALRVAELEPDDAFSFTALSVIYQRCGAFPRPSMPRPWPTRNKWDFTEKSVASRRLRVGTYCAIGSKASGSCSLSAA